MNKEAAYPFSKNSFPKSKNAPLNSNGRHFDIVMGNLYLPVRLPKKEGEIRVVGGRRRSPGTDEICQSSLIDKELFPYF